MHALFDPTVYRAAVIAYYAIGVVTLVLLLFVRAPYGRYDRSGWGPKVASRLAWVVMEAPASLLFLAFYLAGQHRAEVGSLVLLGMWQAHYAQRAFVFPFLLRIRGKTVPVLIPLLAICVNSLNAYVNAVWIAHFGSYPAAWLADPRFIAGATLFVGGYVINRWADTILRDLRAPGETHYEIPHGFLYRWVSSPNYLGELIEWTGWAVATWSWAGGAFAFYTFANLLPRALQNHRWYHERFEDYPPERKALIPYVL